MIVLTRGIDVPIGEALITWQVSSPPPNVMQLWSLWEQTHIRKEPPPFFEMAVLEAEPVYRKESKKRTVDIKLTKFLPSLTEVPSKELEALQERAIRSGFDFIDFWAIDFDYQDGQPFEHHWQDYRTRKDRTLKTVSDAAYDKYAKKGSYNACVKVVDVFGCDTSITVNVEI